MATLTSTITIPSNGSEVAVFTGGSINALQISLRNTGGVTLLLGPAGQASFPLLGNEFLGIQAGADDALMCKVQTIGTAGQVSLLAMG